MNGKPGYQVCLLLGSNIRPEENLRRAVAALRRELTVLQLSSVWESPPAAGSGPDFLNAALLGIAHQPAAALKQELLRPLEARLGRVRTADKNAPRPIDLDIVVFDQTILDPDLFRYAHRAVPVAEVLPACRSRGGESLQSAADRLASRDPIRMRADVRL